MGGHQGVRLADGVAPGVGKAILQLSVTDAIGRNSITPVEINFANLAGIKNVFYSRLTSIASPLTQLNAFADTDKTGTLIADTSHGYLSVTYTDLTSNNTKRIDFSDAAGGIPSVGNYSGALSQREFGSTSPLLGYLTGCGATGSFKVLEIQVDGSGNVKQLAIDFDQQCVRGTDLAPVNGSIRIDSSVPVRF